VKFRIFITPKIISRPDDIIKRIAAEEIISRANEIIDRLPDQD
jgi:hypothetical protein